MKKGFPSESKCSIIKKSNSGLKMSGSSVKTWFEKVSYSIKSGLQSVLCTLKIFTLFLGSKIKVFFIFLGSCIKKFGFFIGRNFKHIMPVLGHSLKTAFCFIGKNLKKGFLAVCKLLKKASIGTGKGLKTFFCFLGRDLSKGFVAIGSGLKIFFCFIGRNLGKLGTTAGRKLKIFFCFLGRNIKKGVVALVLLLKDTPEKAEKRAERKAAREAAIATRKTELAERRAAAVAERNVAAEERKTALVARKSVAAERRAALIAERKASFEERKIAFENRKAVAAERRAAAVTERNIAAEERKAELAERKNAAVAKREIALAEKKAAVAERKVAVAGGLSAIVKGLKNGVASVGKFFHGLGMGISNFFRVIMNSRTLKIVSLSVTGFFVGITVTGVVLLSTGKKTDKQEVAQAGVGGLETVSAPVSGVEVSASIDNNLAGVGGLETAGVPEFNESLEALLDGDNLEVNSSFLNEDVVTYEDVDEEEDEEPSLTYETYRVRTGDMISVIADKYGVTQDTIISVNNIKQSRLIQPGQYLKIPSMAGIIYTVKKNGETPASIAEKYDINAEKCALVNYMDTDTALTAGASLFLPDAELDWATRQEINGDLFKCPLHCRYWLSSPYGWRDSPFNPGKRSFHGGIDMACSTGNNVYPAMDGVVVEASYNRIYGNYVIVQHHSGYKTLYGHLSRIMCRTGNFVYTSTCIGKVGSTGMSTGPHLHFTVYKYGKTVNPSLLLN